MVIEMNKLLRPYLGISPSVEPSVFIDPSAVVIGDVRLANDVSI